MYKLHQLTALINQACKLRMVTKKLLQGITGLLIHPMMHRRSLMCLLQDTFLWAEKLNDSDRKQLPIGVKEELLSCALLLPLCHANIRWSVSCRIGASDASSTHGGRAAALVTPSIAQTLFRFAEHKVLTGPRAGFSCPAKCNRLPKNLRSSCSVCHGTKRKHAVLPISNIKTSRRLE